MACKHTKVETRKYPALGIYSRTCRRCGMQAFETAEHMRRLSPEHIRKISQAKMGNKFAAGRRAVKCG